MKIILIFFVLLIAAEKLPVLSQEQTHLSSFARNCPSCDWSNYYAHLVLSHIMATLRGPGYLNCLASSNRTICQHIIDFSYKVVGYVGDSFPRGHTIEEENTKGLTCVTLWNNCYEQTRNGTGIKSCISCEKKLKMALFVSLEIAPSDQN